VHVLLRREPLRSMEVLRSAQTACSSHEQHPHPTRGQALGTVWAEPGRGPCVIEKAICWPFAEPSDGLEPSTPSLPSPCFAFSCTLGAPSLRTLDGLVFAPPSQGCPCGNDRLDPKGDDYEEWRYPLVVEILSRSGAREAREATARRSSNSRASAGTAFRRCAGIPTAATTMYFVQGCRVRDDANVTDRGCHGSVAPARSVQDFGYPRRRAQAPT